MNSKEKNKYLEEAADKLADIFVEQIIDNQYKDKNNEKETLQDE